MIDQIYGGERIQSHSFSQVLGKTRETSLISVYWILSILRNTQGQGGSGVGQSNASHVWQTPEVRAAITTLLQHAQTAVCRLKIQLFLI